MNPEPADHKGDRVDRHEVHGPVPHAVPDIAGVVAAKRLDQPPAPAVDAAEGGRAAGLSEGHQVISGPSSRGRKGWVVQGGAFASAGLGGGLLSSPRGRFMWCCRFCGQLADFIQVVGLRRELVRAG